MHLKRVTGVSPSVRIPFAASLANQGGFGACNIFYFSISFFCEILQKCCEEITKFRVRSSQPIVASDVGAALRRKSELFERALTKQRSVFPPLKNRGGNVGPRGRLISMNRGGQADIQQLLPRTFSHWPSRLGQLRSMHGSMLPSICSPIALFFALQLRDVQIYKCFGVSGYICYYCWY